MEESGRVDRGPDLESELWKLVSLKGMGIRQARVRTALWSWGLKTTLTAGSMTIRYW